MCCSCGVCIRCVWTSCLMGSSDPVFPLSCGHVVVMWCVHPLRVGFVSSWELLLCHPSLMCQCAAHVKCVHSLLVWALCLWEHCIRLTFDVSWEKPCAAHVVCASFACGLCVCGITDSVSLLMCCGRLSVLPMWYVHPFLVGFMSVRSLYPSHP